MNLAPRTVPAQLRGRRRHLDSNEMTDAAAQLAVGLANLRPLLEQHGFGQRAGEETGQGSGGPFATATFVKDDRQLHLWLRGDSLSVTYRLGEQELDHATLMRELLGPGGPNEFPAYVGDAELAFIALRHDLERFCNDFLAGTGDDFQRCATAAEHATQLTGAQRLARTERALKQQLGEQ